MADDQDDDEQATLVFHVCHARSAVIRRTSVGKVLPVVEDGAWNDSLKQRLIELAAEKRQLQKQLATTVTPDNTGGVCPAGAPLVR
jgi:hypothetical protein